MCFGEGKEDEIREMREKGFKTEGWVCDNIPAFYQIIRPGHSNDKLEIPPQFNKYVLEGETEMAILKVPPHGVVWHVKVIKHVDSLYLEEGWHKFVTDNVLGDNEFLVFRYDGNMCFDVKIFEKNGCERIHASGACQAHNSALPGPKRKPGRPRKNSAAVLKVHQPVPYPPQKHPDTNMVKTEEYADLPIQDPCLNKRDEATKRLIKPRRTGFSSQAMDAHTTRSLQVREPAAEEIEAIRKATKSFTSSFPHFKICMKEYNVDRVFILTIPSSFSRVHLSRSEFITVLRNSDGKSWTLRIVPTTGKGLSFCAGCRAFVRGNLLKIGDCCIFELVERNLLQVHIFRTAKRI